VKKSRFTEEQIAFALKQQELGTPVEEICRKMGIAQATFFNWKKRFSGLGPSELRRLRQLEEENTRLKKLVARWAYERQVELAFSRPGKPTDNAFIEAFNGRLRQECLNQHWFLSLADARSKIEAWRQGYNETRPHGALGWATPAEFARRCLQADVITCSKDPENSASEQF
jgi:transposase InsO family protein